MQDILQGFTKQFLANQSSSAFNRASFISKAVSDMAIRSKVIFYYKRGYPDDGVVNMKPISIRLGETKIDGSIAASYDDFQLGNRKDNLANFDETDDNSVRNAANWIYSNYSAEWIRENILGVAENENAASDAAAASSKSARNTEPTQINQDGSLPPFDKRLYRFEYSYENPKNPAEPFGYMPYSTEFTQLATTGYIIEKGTLEGKPDDFKDEALKKWEKDFSAIKADSFYKGVPALQNSYAVVRLYGSEGGQHLVNQKGKRRWYEIDTTSDSALNFASTPTTSALIDWAGGDPYGRTPYQFTDFVFSKYWNKIQNNRLITLRRYAAPILDNLKFPGMVSNGAPGGDNDATFAFPPMATAVTYFGGETGNSLSSILKFTTGVLWEDIQADVWAAMSDSVPGNESGPGAIFGGVAKFAEMLNVAGGKFDRDFIMNQGQIPPDPYENGPYENRIKGPINRIDTVAKRKPGLAFEWSGLNLVFEYVARPVGGINPKAVLLDIMSNFLVMGSASAVFFGGAHRFMANPSKYPFLGGKEGMEKWYKGDPIGWGVATIKQFTNPAGGADIGSVGSSLLKSFESFFSQLFSGESGNIVGAVTSIFSGATGNLIGNALAKKSGGQIPYLSGMKAILTGEPVGEWHVTVGNPLNPIAMIGNLICDNVTIEFNEELGPDDFPTEMKVTVKLKHAMARDRDAIESVFNRGMGRIYSLPDSFKGSADFQTAVDETTTKDGRSTDVGYMKSGRMGIAATGGGRYVDPKQLKGRELSTTKDDTSIWNRASFRMAVSENSSQQFIQDKNNLIVNSYRAANWIAQRSLM